MIGFAKFIISLTLQILFSYVFSEVLYHTAYAILLAFRYAESYSNNTLIMRLKRDLRKFRLFKYKKKGPDIKLSGNTHVPKTKAST